MSLKKRIATISSHQPGDIEKTITSNTHMASISTVQYLTGLKSDLKTIGEICQYHGILFVADGIQGPGFASLLQHKSRIGNCTSLY